MALLAWAWVGSVFGLLGVPWLALTGRRAAACVVLGLALGLAAASTALAWALNPEPRTQAAGVAAWAAVVVLAALALAAARRPHWQRPVLLGGALVCAAMAAFGAYLVAGFRIF